MIIFKFTILYLCQELENWRIYSLLNGVASDQKNDVFAYHNSLILNFLIKNNGWESFVMSPLNPCLLTGASKADESPPLTR